MQPKPPLTLRRAPANRESDAAAIEQFIAQGPKNPDVQASEPPDLQVPKEITPEKMARGPGLVRRQSGKVRRRMTVYLPPDLARALLLRAVGEGEEVSEIVSSAVALYLKSV
jgi:hypothetical protein